MKTNEDFIIECMNFSKYGALGQIAVLQCLELGIKEFQKAEKKNLEDEENGQRSFINMASFHGAVNELSDKYNKFYNTLNK